MIHLPKRGLESGSGNTRATRRNGAGKPATTLSGQKGAGVVGFGRAARPFWLQDVKRSGIDYGVEKFPAEGFYFLYAEI
jgi:hypothetical protein